jgi:hypothetical protein
MATGTQDTAGYYVWEVAGKPVVVRVHLEVIDRMLPEVMRGFGAVPKRGAEVGGVLIGTIARDDDQTIVSVEDFEPVECGYKRGPSFLFVDEERAAFADAVARWRPDDARPAYAVGFYRSHTRDGMQLAEEDVQLMDEFFSSPAHVALLIRPYATKVSTAGFFFRENGVFPEATPLEFPFRRRELAGEEAPPRRPLESRSMDQRAEPRSIERRAPRPMRDTRPVPEPEPEEEYAPPEMARQTGPAYAVTLPSRSRLRSAIWIPLSFVFLLFGVALGMMISLSRAPGRSDTGDLSLGLAVGRADQDVVLENGRPQESGYNLSVKWDRAAAAVHAAQHGVLEIEDGKYTKSVDLDPAQLSSGGIVYRNSSPTVRFRLTVYPRARVSVTETAEWKQ